LLIRKTPVKNCKCRDSKTNKWDSDSFVNVKNVRDESRIESIAIHGINAGNSYLKLFTELK